MELYQEDRELVRERPPMWQGYVLGGWWRRVGAYLLDGFVMTAIAVLLVLVLELQLDGVFSALLEPLGVVSVGAVAALVYVDGLWPLWDPQNRAIHDMLAGTRVVRAGTPPPSPTPPVRRLFRARGGVSVSPPGIAPKKGRRRLSAPPPQPPSCCRSSAEPRNLKSLR